MSFVCHLFVVSGESLWISKCCLGLGAGFLFLLLKMESPENTHVREGDLCSSKAGQERQREALLSKRAASKRKTWKRELRWRGKPLFFGVYQCLGFNGSFSSGRLSLHGQANKKLPFLLRQGSWRCSWRASSAEPKGGYGAGRELMAALLAHSHRASLFGCFGVKAGLLVNILAAFRSCPVLRGFGSWERGGGGLAPRLATCCFGNGLAPSASRVLHRSLTHLCPWFVGSDFGAFLCVGLRWVV